MITIWALIPLITFVIYIALFVLTLPSLERRINRIFALYLSVAAIWSFTSFMLHFNAFPQQALFWNEILTAALAGTLITYYHFIRAYTNKPAGISVYTGYALVLILTGLSLSGYIVKYAYVVDGILYHSLGISIYIIGAVCFIYIGAGLYLLIKTYRNSIDPIARNRTVYLVVGWSILMLLSTTNLVMVPSIAGIPLDHIGSLANILIITYAIRRYQLLNIKLVARRGLAYLILVSALLGVYAGAILLGRWLLSEQPFYNILLLASGLVILIAFLARPLRYVIQERIDRFFYGGTYHYRQALLSFSTKMGNIINLNELADEMLPTISKALLIPEARLLFEDVSSGDFTTQFAYPKAKAKLYDEPRFNLDSLIVTWLDKVVEPLYLRQIDNIPQFKGLWQKEREMIIASDLEILYPIKNRGKLVGILALARKQSGRLYSHEDMDLVASIASQASIIIENARMFDSLKKQQRQVEQLLAQVVLAQEEERQRISIDLHDSVAQWLVGASYQAQTFSQLVSKDSNGIVNEELANMENTISKSLRELRRIVIGLRPPALDELGLTHALQQSLDELKSDGLDCQFYEEGTPFRLPSNIEIAVYRVVQESLSNIRKHADATEVKLRLQFQKDKVLVEVHDNGQGFNVSEMLDQAMSTGHVGLLGMKQRAEMLGGDINIKTSKEIGTTITLTLPILIPIEGR